MCTRMVSSVIAAHAVTSGFADPYRKFVEASYRQADLKLLAVEFRYTF